MSDEPPPPPPLPTEPRFPGRERIVAVGGALGLIAVAVALLTLPDGERVPSIAAAHDSVHITANDSAALLVVPPAPPAPPPPAPPPAAAAPAKPALTEINAAALPRGSSVRLDGKPTARRHMSVIPGRHILEVAAVGYVTRIDTVQVVAGQPLTWTPHLTAAPVAKAPAAPPKVAVDPPPPAKRANPDEALCRQEMGGSAWRDAYQSCGRAAQSGSVAAQRNLGTLFLRGDGVRRSEDSAAHWFTLAARSGDGEAMFQLGVAYERGKGVAKDQGAAVDWYNRSANGGHAAAEFAVGELFEKGRLGVTKDKVKALEWYRRAAAQGNKDAASKVKDLDR